MRYEQPAEGVWVQPIRHGYKMRCCDCGLVHKMDFRVSSGHAQFRVFRDNRATAAIRRGGEGYVPEGMTAEKLRAVAALCGERAGLYDAPMLAVALFLDGLADALEVSTGPVQPVQPVDERPTVDSGRQYVTEEDAFYGDEAR